MINFNDTLPLPLRFSFDNPSHLGRKEIEKVCAVALASFAFLTLQYGVPLTMAASIAIAAAGLTLLSETTLRGTNPYFQKNWFDLTTVDRTRLVNYVSMVFKAQLIWGVIFTALAVPPAQVIGKLIQSRNWHTIVLATLVAPITEEILFRGFLQERLEDTAYLFSRFIHPLSDNVQNRISNFGQAIIFGYVHMHKAQTKLANTLIFALTGGIGLLMSSFKGRRDNLITPILAHSANNTSFCLRLLAFGH